MSPNQSPFLKSVPQLLSLPIFFSTCLTLSHSSLFLDSVYFLLSLTEESVPESLPLQNSNGNYTLEGQTQRLTLGLSIKNNVLTMVIMATVNWNY